MISKTVITDSSTDGGISRTTTVYALGFWGFIALYHAVSCVTQVLCAYAESKAPLREDEKPALKSVEPRKD
jgi:hypothetical protein